MKDDNKSQCRQVTNRDINKPHDDSQHFVHDSMSLGAISYGRKAQDTTAWTSDAKLVAPAPMMRNGNRQP